MHWVVVVVPAVVGGTPGRDVEVVVRGDVVAVVVGAGLEGRAPALGGGTATGRAGPLVDELARWPGGTDGMPAVDVTGWPVVDPGVAPGGAGAGVVGAAVFKGAGAEMEVLAWFGVDLDEGRVDAPGVPQAASIAVAAAVTAMAAVASRVMPTLTARPAKRIPGHESIPKWQSDVLMGVARVGLPVDRMSDDSLLAGIGSGDPDAALAFVRRFQSHVYAVALAIAGDPGTAEDIAQQTFVRAWRRGPTFDASRGSVRAWLTAITRYAAIDALRVRKPEPVDPTDLIRLLAPAHREPEATTIRNERQAELQHALRQLPPEQGRALVMAGVYRMTAQEVADTEGIPLGTAKTRIRSAMQKVRESLSAPEVTHE